ncbi:MAG TPA: hypothetical protein VK609_19840, partial [Mucilaginibacter sp.]|nr:hypothetical protein [Mucilaginibacter sp.]
MFIRRLYTTVICFSILPVIGFANPIAAKPQLITLSHAKLTMAIDYGDKACITSLIVNGQKVISDANGVFTSVKVGGTTYSSLNLKRKPVLVQTPGSIKISGISYGDKDLTINENWIFLKKGKSVKWVIER